jgi:hypothetical protein
MNTGVLICAVLFLTETLIFLFEKTGFKYIVLSKNIGIEEILEIGIKEIFILICS